MARPPILHVSHLHVRRGAAHLLRDVSWRIDHGQHWVLLGPNGSGKTTLLKVLMGLLTPSAGEIALLGHTYGSTDWRDVRRHIGLVSSALHAHIPPGEVALETVISGRYAQLDLWQSPTPSDVRAARRALKTISAEQIADRPWAWLSQGERQRVLIARALVARPHLLVLDEPCAGLDPVARQDFVASLERLTRDPRSPALVLVTHHVEEITAGFTDVLLLAAGAVVAAGPRARVLTSAQLTRTFGRPVRLQRRGGSWALQIAAPSTAAEQVVERA